MKRQISDYHLQIGLTVQKYREEKEISPAAFARLIGVKIEILNRIERGEINFRLTTLIKLMQVMGKVPFPSK
jgi:transcriptional regulator with XRE-family HTH domain